MYNNKTSQIDAIYVKGLSMLRFHFNFDYKKATQALNHLALKELGEISKLKALKLIHLADRYHLRKYGRLITNDIYFAMNYGPVPSGVKDIAEGSDFLGEKELEYSSKYLASVDQNTLKSVTPVEDSVFSDSDIEALDFAWEKFGHLDPFTLAKLTHEYPEWARHKEALKVDSRVQIYLEDFLDDPETDIEKCFELNEEDRTARREQLAELARITLLWS
jgi:uncharacterized phage-associated protein